MKINDIITKRRSELGITTTEVCKRVDMSLNEYYDVEYYEDEILTVTDLRRVKLLCDVLGINLLDLLGLKELVSDDTNSFRDYLSLLRNELIAKRRREIGISREELGERLGFYSVEIDKLEMNPEHLETWPIEFIKELAAVIAVPIQILLKVKCDRGSKG